MPLPDGSLLFAQLDYVNPYQRRSDLWVQRGGREHRLTVGARLTTPDGSYFNYTYNDAKRITLIENNLGQKQELTYDLDGNVTDEVTGSLLDHLIDELRHDIPNVGLFLADELGCEDGLDDVALLGVP